LAREIREIKGTLTLRVLQYPILTRPLRYEFGRGYDVKFKIVLILSRITFSTLSRSDAK